MHILKNVESFQHLVDSLSSRHGEGNRARYVEGKIIFKMRNQDNFNAAAGGGNIHHIDYDSTEPNQPPPPAVLPTPVIPTVPVVSPIANSSPTVPASAVAQTSPMPNVNAPVTPVKREKQVPKAARFLSMILLMSEIVVSSSSP